MGWFEPGVEFAMGKPAQRTNNTANRSISRGFRARYLAKMPDYKILIKGGKVKQSGRLFDGLQRERLSLGEPLDGLS